METIQNPYLRLQVSCRGAEIQSLVDLSTNRELIWQGDPAYWHRHSPLLFPIVGGMWNGRTSFGNKEYRIPKHGFMNDRSFNLAEHTDDCLRYVYASTEEDRKLFPFDFTLEVIYTLHGKTLDVRYEVENCSYETMYFQIGGHPGFNLPEYRATDHVHGYASFEGSPQSLLRAGDQGCTEPDRIEMPELEENLLPLRDEMFAHDALIFDEAQINAVTLYDKKRAPFVKLRSEAPAFLLWRPYDSGASFLCIEPWYGLCDKQHFEGPFEQRPYVNKALPGKRWSGGFTIDYLR